MCVCVCVCVCVLACVCVCPQGQGNLSGLLIQPAPSLPSFINLPSASASFSVDTHMYIHLHTLTHTHLYMQSFIPTHAHTHVNIYFKGIICKIFNMSNFLILQHFPIAISQYISFHCLWSKLLMAESAFSVQDSNCALTHKEAMHAGPGCDAKDKKLMPSNLKRNRSCCPLSFLFFVKTEGRDESSLLMICLMR